MLLNIEFTKGEAYELNDALAAALQDILTKGDPENYEAKYGTASNLASAIRKVAAAVLGEPVPSWVGENEAQVLALREAKRRDPTVRAAVADYVAWDSKLQGAFIPDGFAWQDGIRDFVEDKRG